MVGQEPELVDVLKKLVCLCPKLTGGNVAMKVVAVEGVETGAVVCVYGFRNSPDTPKQLDVALFAVVDGWRERCWSGCPG